MLIRMADLQSVIYIVAYPSLMAYQWLNGIQWTLFALMLILSVGLSVVQHNHTHLRMWKNKPMNRFTDWILSVIQGVPSFVFFPSHIGNHHKHNHGPEDETRTYRFGGHHNHIIGYLLHPIQALSVLVPKMVRHIPKRWKKGDYWPFIETLSIVIVSGLLISIDAYLWFVLVALPQLHGVHWLLGSNYLQHAGARPGAGVEAGANTPDDSSRNFTGFVNVIWFNIGYHSAHHGAPRAHWADLPKLHKEHRHRMDDWLVERSLGFYIARTLCLGGLGRQRTYQQDP